jgi:hypothetical protein
MPASANDFRLPLLKRRTRMIGANSTASKASTRVTLRRYKYVLSYPVYRRNDNERSLSDENFTFNYFPDRNHLPCLSLIKDKKVDMFFSIFNFHFKVIKRIDFFDRSFYRQASSSTFSFIRMMRSFTSSRSS